MSAKLKAAEGLGQFLRPLAGLLALQADLERVGSLEQAATEAESRAIAAQQASDRAKAEHEAAVNGLGKAREQAEQVNSAANAAAAAIRAGAKEAVEAEAAKLKARSDAAQTKASAKLKATEDLIDAAVARQAKAEAAAVAAEQGKATLESELAALRAKIGA